MANLLSKHRVKLACMCSVAALMTFSGSAQADDSAIMAQLQKMQAQIEAQNAKINQLQAKLAKKSSGTHGGGLDEEAVNDIVVDVVEESLENYADENKPAIDVSGYTTFAYTTSNQNGADGRQLFSLPETRLVFQGRANEKFGAVIEFEYQNAFEASGGGGADIEGGFSMERAYLEYNHNKQVNARAGKFFQPMGIWAPKHWAVSTDSVSTPSFIENNFFKASVIGAQGFGSWAPDAEGSVLTDVSYSAYVTNGIQDGGTETAQTGSLGYGGNLATTFADKYMIGLSASGYKDPGRVAGANDVPGVVNIMPYAKFELPNNITLSAEYIYQDWDESLEDRHSWYGAAKWQFHPKAYAYYRYDDGSAPVTGAGDADEEQANTFTLGYWPIPNVRTKLEFSTHDFDNAASEGYERGTAWVGFVF